MKDKTNKTRLVGFRLQPDENEKIAKAFRATTCRKLSDYIRKIIFEKPVVTNYRNRSMDDFIEEMICLRTELNRLGNNFNQVVKRLYTLQHADTIAAVLSDYEKDKEKLLHQTEAIFLFIEKNAALW